MESKADNTVTSTSKDSSFKGQDPTKKEGTHERLTAQHVDQLLLLRDDYKSLRQTKKKIFNSKNWNRFRGFGNILKAFGLKNSLDQDIKTLNSLTTEVNSRLKLIVQEARKIDAEGVKKIASDLASIKKKTKLYLIEPELVTPSKIKVELPKYSAPEVSIIIPAYDQANYTYASILAIALHTDDNIPYEVILIDDCSPSSEAQMLKSQFGNLVYIRNEKNLGFLLNCNKAAKQARGKYILFLNNDTNVQPGWLSPLVHLMEHDDNVGMVGSRLVYPDGLQQEAGGIIWNNGSGWNFGRLGNPKSFEFNYVKESDYISGASIMIRKELWEEIGGFDERYIPAYFEDTDLAFEVRKRGYKVKYQPKSWVVHFEGISHGKDESSGIKEYQKLNREKFVKKWAKELEHQFANGQNAFLAKDRGQFKKTILIIDHYVPQYDRDAGSRSTFGYIKLFVETGFNVKFLTDNFHYDKVYAPILQDMGVEVMYGGILRDNLTDWFKKNGQHLDYVFLNRPHVAAKHIEPLTQYSNAKILYYGHDLHFLRKKREIEALNEGDENASLEWEQKEMSIMTKVQASFFPSDVEVELVRSKNSEINVSQIPVYIFDNFEPLKKGTNQDIMFVGGFNHPPNVDGIIWFISEIWPVVLAEMPEVKFYIVGSNPPEQISALASDQVIVTGFVSDEELHDLYKNRRLCVAPLRYGAGIKGKIVEALYHQIPTITTSIGAEGLVGSESCLRSHDDPDEFAKAIIALYQDQDELSRMSDEGLKYCQKHFSKEAAISALSPHIDFS